MRSRSMIRTCVFVASAWLATSFVWPASPSATAAFPGKNGVIAYTETYTGGSAIWLMNADGSGSKAITDPTGDNLFPAWSADGAKIAFVSYRNEHNDIFTMNGDGTGQKEITRNMAAAGDDSVDSDPAWSPDGTKIAFDETDTGRYNGVHQIYVVNADGTGRTNITSSADHDDSQPAWSPDGRAIAVTTGSGGIDLLSPDGGNRRHLNSDGTWPAWSPDGSQIAYLVGSQPTLWTMRKDGTNQRKVATAPIGAYRSVRWSPDGSRFVVAVYDSSDGHYRIDVLHADGTGEVVVKDSGHPGSAYRPDWQPLPAKTATTPGPTSPPSAATNGDTSTAHASASAGGPVSNKTHPSASPTSSIGPTSSPSPVTGGFAAPDSTTSATSGGRHRTFWPYLAGGVAALGALGGALFWYFRGKAVR